MDEYVEMFISGPDSAALEASVLRRRIRRLWHVTHISALESIFKHGAILSRASMDSMGIEYEMSTWGTSGKEEEMADYICCSLVPPWGMAKKDPETKVVLSLDPRLIWREGTVFSPEWSSSNTVMVSELQSKYTIQAFDSMFDNPTTSWPSPYSVEIVVFGKIPVHEFLPQMFFYNEESKNAAKAICGERFLPDMTSKVCDTFRFWVDRRKFRGTD